MEHPTAVTCIEEYSPYYIKNPTQVHQTLFLVVTDITLDFHRTLTFRMSSIQAREQQPVIIILISLLLCTHSSRQCMKGWIIYIRCQGLTLAHYDFQHELTLLLEYIVSMLLYYKNLHVIGFKHTYCSDFYMLLTVCLNSPHPSQLCVKYDLIFCFCNKTSGGRV